MRRAWIVMLALALAACSSGGHKAKSSTTTLPSSIPSTSSLPSTTTTGTSGSTGGTTVPSPPTTSGSTGGSSVKITSFAYSGDSPVQCNAPTQVEMKWTTSGAAAVTMSYDNAVIANYPNGAHDVLLPLDCDGKSHTFTLKATAPGVNATRSITIDTQKS